MLLTYRYRVKPTRAQHAALAALSEAQRHLYNAALEERISAWQKAGISITRFDQYKSLTLIPAIRHRRAAAVGWWRRRRSLSAGMSVPAAPICIAITMPLWSYYKRG